MGDARQGLFSRLLQSSYLVPVTLAVIAVLAVGIVVQFLAIAAIAGALPGARVHDLVTAAGGATADADLTLVSLAGALPDGGTVYVPRMGESIPLMLGGKLNINTASEQDFRYALGLGADIARRIVAYRAEHGPFTAISQLLLAPISQTTYDRIRLLVTV